MIQKQQRWVGLLTALVLLALFSVAPATPSQAQNTQVYFPQTGHYLGGAFRSAWESRGGLAVFGYPITEEYVRKSDGRIVQYFERARFELDVVNNQAVVSLGLVGRDYMDLKDLGFPPVAPVPNTSTQRYFPETGHTIKGAFKNYWESRGGLGIFGFPLSEEVVERLGNGQNYTVQYFERARFELHGSQVQLSLLGLELAPCQLRPALPANAAPNGPVPEGDPASCAAIPNATAHGRVYPEVSAPGTVLGFEAWGYEPGEPVSLWMNLPNGTVRALPYQAIAGGDGGVLIGFRTEAGDPTGSWSLVGQGTRSGRVVLAGFRLQW